VGAFSCRRARLTDEAGSSTDDGKCIDPSPLVMADGEFEFNGSKSLASSTVMMQLSLLVVVWLLFTARRKTNDHRVDTHEHVIRCVVTSERHSVVTLLVDRMNDDPLIELTPTNAQLNVSTSDSSVDRLVSSRLLLGSTFYTARRETPRTNE
jgi:hypothetical protein